MLATLLLMAAVAINAPSAHAAPTYEFMLSASPLRTAGQHNLATFTVSPKVYLGGNPPDGIRMAQFYLDQESAPFTTKRQPHFDAMGTAKEGTANAIVLTHLTPGRNQVVAKATTTAGTVQALAATIEIPGSKPMPSPIATLTPSPTPAPSHLPLRTPTTKAMVNWHPGNWVYLGNLANTAQLTKALNSPYIKGVLVRMMWARDKVNPAKGQYDFSKFDSLLNQFKAKGKYFAILFMAQSYWGGDAVPAWVQTPEYAGGQVKAGARVQPKMWLPKVNDEMIAMQAAIAKHYEGNPWFELLHGGETSYDGGGSPDFSQTALTTELKRQNKEIGAAFVTSTYYVGGNWARTMGSVISEAYAWGEGLTGPDLAVWSYLKNPPGISIGPNWGYPCYNRSAFVPPVDPKATCDSDYYGKMPLAISGQVGLERSIKAGYTMQEIYDFAFNSPAGLRVSYVFWGYPYETPGKGFDNWILPHIESVQGKFMNSACPENIIKRGGCKTD